MIGYFIAIETDDSISRIGPFFTPTPIDDNRVAKELRDALPHNIATLGPDFIEDMVLIGYDGSEAQIFNLDPYDFFPVIPTTRNDKKFYTEKGGEK